MSVALARDWTFETFLDWAETQEGRYEFDGIAPVGMTNPTFMHDQVNNNLLATLRLKLRGTDCRYAGPSMAVRCHRSLRRPDALITCTRQPGTDRVVTDPVAVFEVLSPSTARVDRITKVRGYAAVPSILHYVLIESRFPGVTLLHRNSGADSWTTTVLDTEDTLALPEPAIDFPIALLYEDVEFPSSAELDG